MTTVWVALAVLGGLAALGLAALLLLGRGARITRGRYGRLARMGRLGARLWSSWLGAKIRRLFMSKNKRAGYDERRRQRDAEAVTRTMGQMKGTFMKLGQMMSFITDSIPQEYRAALASLQTQAPPMEFAAIRDVAERELGKPLERAFARFDERPLASASIGQVHRAVLPTGAEVAVKVQYPGVADAIRADLQNAGALYRMAGMFYSELDSKAVVAELRARFGEELDYVREADNQEKFRRVWAGHPAVVVPRVFPSHSTSRVLTSEYMRGRKFEQVLELDQSARDHFGEVLWRFVFESIVRHGMFNGDPHPGNYLFTDDGKVVFLDYGCVKYFPDEMLANWVELVRRHLEGRREDFRSMASELGFFRLDSPLPADLVYDFFGYFYEPISADRDFTFTSEYNAESLGMVFRPTGKFDGIVKKLNMPPDFFLVNRIQWGVHSILAKLGASMNWHRIHRELLYGDPPSTPLGRAAAGMSDPPPFMLSRSA